jgi:hypothetical protein
MLIVRKLNILFLRMSSSEGKEYVCFLRFSGTATANGNAETGINLLRRQILYIPSNCMLIVVYTGVETWQQCNK